MFVAVVGVGIVGTVAVASAHDDHRNHSNHSNYSDSNVRDQIARMESEVQDLEQKLSRMNGEFVDDFREELGAVMDDIRSRGSMSQEMIDALQSSETSNDLDKRLLQFKKPLIDLVRREQKRLEEIDRTIARINEIELGGDE